MGHYQYTGRYVVRGLHPVFRLKGLGLFAQFRAQFLGTLSTSPPFCYML